MTDTTTEHPDPLDQHDQHDQGGDGWDDEPADSSVALFEGDEGGLDVLQRRALVALLKHRFISAQTHPSEWRAVAADPDLFRGRLHDLFLDLAVDVEREVAHKRQVTPEGGGRPFPTLLHDTPWGREETLVLVFLRGRFRAETGAGTTRAYVDRDAALAYVEQFRPRHATDVAGDARRARAAFEAVYRTGLLLGPAMGDRFEISRAIEVLLPMERLQELLTWLRQTNAGEQPGEPGTAEPTSYDDGPAAPGAEDAAPPADEEDEPFDLATGDGERAEQPGQADDGDDEQHDEHDDEQDGTW